MNMISYGDDALGDCMQAFVSFKRMQGYDYSVAAYKLKKFHNYLLMKGYKGDVLQADLVNEYILGLMNLRPKHRKTFLCCVRQFSEYLHCRKPASYVLQRQAQSATPAVLRFYLYSAEDISRLMSAALNLQTRSGIRPHCARFLWGFLYCTGLRISEALALNLDDVDLLNQRLFIRRGKFSKQRYVPLHKSTVEKTRRWLQFRRKHTCSDLPTSPLFVNDRGDQVLKYNQAHRAFMRCREACHMEHCVQPPRLHDFRHTYACNCILNWQARGVDVNAKLPILATVLGHVNIQSSQIYLHISSEQLRLAAGKFHEFYLSNKGDLS